MPENNQKEAGECLSHTFTTSSTDEELGEFLLTLRKKLGLTQVDAAKKLSTGTFVLNRIEKGRCSPRWSNVLRYATANGRKMQLTLIPLENT